MVLATKALFVAAVVASLAACEGGREPGPEAPSPQALPTPATTAAEGNTGADGKTASGPTKPARAASASTGWTVTVYYTAVVRFHSGKPVKVSGCPTIDCQHGDTDLGTYPSDFVDAVKDEGAGKVADGRYLNWSYDTGYWLDTAPRVSDGGVLHPFETAAADPQTLRAGTAFQITACGKDEHGDAIDQAVCERLRKARWTIADEFTPGLGGKKHVDVYIGEETGTNFTDSPWYTTLTGATLAIS